MLNSWVFLVFTAATVIIYWLLVPKRARSLFLALASAAYFYCYYPKEILFLGVLALITYIAARLASGRVNSRPVMVAAVVMLIGSLAFFKYARFLAENLGFILRPLIKTPLTIPEIFVPIGISYFTFKMIHYVVDSYRGKIGEHSLFDFLNYIFFFPILVSGPIERFQPFLATIKEAPSFKAEHFTEGLPRIIAGLFKKVVLADTLAATAALLQQQGLDASHYWLASFAYTLQLYFDFSGYSDMAIGIGRLFGFRIMENFDWPYLANDISVFWKKWHMSLTGFFRDYLFIPLGGSRGSLKQTIRNTFIVMAVTGLWHGAAWHFVFWGLYHALGLIGLRLYRQYALPALKSRTAWLDSPVARVFNVLLTFNFVNIGWVFFACDAQQSIYVLSRMFHLIGG